VWLVRQPGPHLRRQRLPGGVHDLFEIVRLADDFEQLPVARKRSHMDGVGCRQDSWPIAQRRRVQHVLQ
jgi:hypothetical protein